MVDAISYDGSPLNTGILGLVYLLAWTLLVGIRLYIQPAATNASQEAT